jgi:hypothetical protein
MATPTDRPNAPYAPLGNVLTVIRRLRERGVPVPVTKDALTVLGIPEGNAPRTLQSLKLLGIVAGDGGLTPAAERLRRASTEEYPETLAEIVREAYAPVFAVVDPAVDTEVRIGDAFRQFDPSTQRGRMVTLFLGLCAEAGISSERPEKAPRAPRSSRSAGPRKLRRLPYEVGAAASLIGGAQPTRPRDDAILFGVREADIALLDEIEFGALWDALGTVARARAKANQRRDESEQGGPDEGQ